MATEVLMSFSNAGLGSIFATWLRRRIMRERNLFDTRAVYMDNIAMREQEGTELTQDRRFQTAAAGEDRPTGIILIGARNEAWNEHYLQAMREAKAMIVVATAEWSASQWTWQEFRQAGEEAKGRGLFSKKLRRIALVFPETDADTRAKLSAAGWKLIPCEKIVVGGGRGGASDCAEAAAHEGGWVVRESDLQQILAAL